MEHPDQAPSPIFSQGSPHRLSSNGSSPLAHIFLDNRVMTPLLLATDGPQLSAKGSRAKFSAGRPTVIDEPISEAKEVIAGFAMIDATSRCRQRTYRRTYPRYAGTRGAHARGADHTAIVAMRSGLAPALEIAPIGSRDGWQSLVVSKRRAREYERAASLKRNAHERTLLLERAADAERPGSGMTTGTAVHGSNNR